MDLNVKAGGELEGVPVGLGSRKKLLRSLQIAGGGLAILWLAWFVVVLVIGRDGQGDYSMMGTLGDSMAFFGVFATASALFVASYSLVLQREDLGAQLFEMRKSREAQDRLAVLQERDLRVRKFEALLGAIDRLNEDMDSVFESLKGYSRHHDQAAWSQRDHTDSVLDRMRAKQYMRRHNELWELAYHTRAQLSELRYRVLEGADSEADVEPKLRDELKALHVDWNMHQHQVLSTAEDTLARTDKEDE